MVRTGVRRFNILLRLLRTPEEQNSVLRSSVRRYFDAQAAEVQSSVDSEGANEDLSGLPLKPAQPILGADCRALLLQLEKQSGKVDYLPRIQGCLCKRRRLMETTHSHTYSAGDLSKQCVLQ